MHTTHLLPVSPSMHCSGGGVPAGGYLPRGCTCLGVYLPRAGVPAQGGPTQGGVPAWGGVPAQGVPAQILPPGEQNSWHTLLKILPCPKLRLRSVIRNVKFVMFLFLILLQSAEAQVSFNSSIVKMKEAGLIDRWRTIWSRSPTPCTPPSTDPAQAMRLPAVSGIFLLVLGLSTVAVIVLCVEICVFKKRRNMYRDN